MINSLSDHDAQYLVFNHIFDLYNSNKPLIRKRIITKDATANFTDMLNYYSWDTTFHQNDINKSFNSFLHTFLTFFESCLPLHVTTQTKSNQWVTTGIRIFCKHKKSFYILSKTSNSPKMKAYYTQRKIIRKAKQMYYSDLFK